MQKKIIFITGATAGFGKAIAFKFAEHGFDLILNGRRTERLHAIEKELSELYGCRVLSLAFDITDREATIQMINLIIFPTTGKTSTYL
jgi:3-hydroxy acid dehydrogenase / malonic semialdehyde reductase